VGLLLLVLGLASSHVQRLPITASVIYLGLGFALGPHGLGWLDFKFEPGNVWLERLTEVAVIVALFISGLKMRISPRHRAWLPAYLLAGPIMLLGIGSVALLAHFLFGLSWPYAILLGAILAPTDPVLAGSVSVGHAADKDPVRYSLSGEAGLNDGTAFPFVVLALAWIREESLGGWVARWALFDLLWGVCAALVFGYLLGERIGRWAIRIRSRERDTEAPSDFLALACIALAYTGAHAIHAWGFLAVFAAGVGLRKAELSAVEAAPHPRHRKHDGGSGTHPPAEHLVSARVASKELEAPAVAAGVLVAETISFGGTVERLLEITLVTMVGASLGNYWDSRALVIAGVLFCVVRPLSCVGLLAGTATSSQQRWMIGWFGIRGIGSLYYLAYALNHGVTGKAALQAVNLVLPVIAASILVHGITATPVLNLYRRSLKRRPRSSA
jgi:NhaP-type Na+/H+ or K+/H+ antiporter